MEIKKPRSKPILVSTWYRPPDSPVSHFTEFERMIGSFDAENLEYYLLGDLNFDLCQQVNHQTIDNPEDMSSGLSMIKQTKSEGNIRHI